MTYRINPKTRSLIVSDLTPAHKNKTKRVHGVDEILSKKEFDDYKRKKEEEQLLRDLETQYNTLMLNERYSSNRQGFEIR